MMKEKKNKLIIILILSLFLTGCGKKYTITFDPDGGRPLSSIEVKADELMPFPNESTKEGYKFLGWYYNGEKFNFNTRINQDMTLVAKWEKIEEKEEGIFLDFTNLILKVNETKSLEVTSTLKEEQSLIWTSNNEEVLTVDEEGNLLALKEGEATITVTTYDGKYAQTCSVVVQNDSLEPLEPDSPVDYLVQKVTISGKTEIFVGEKIKLTANVSPKTAPNKEVIWQSSNQDIAIIDENGNVEGLKAGKTVISVTTKDGGKKASIRLTVKANENENTNPNPNEENKEEIKITINGDAEINVHESTNLIYSLTPSENVSLVSWQSSNEQVATVDESGKVTGISEGTATIKLTLKIGEEEKIAEKTIKVNSIYVLTFTKKIEDETLNTYKYIVSLTKDNENITFDQFSYNNKVYQASSLVASEEISKDITQTAVTIAGEVKQATIKYVE